MFKTRSLILLNPCHIQSCLVVQVRTVYTKAEEKLSGAGDLAALAESVARRLGDEERARAIYKKAAEAEDFQNLKFDVAASVERALGDRKLAGSLRV